VLVIGLSLAILPGAVSPIVPMVTVSVGDGTSILEAFVRLLVSARAHRVTKLPVLTVIEILQASVRIRRGQVFGFSH